MQVSDLTGAFRMYRKDVFDTLIHQCKAKVNMSLPLLHQHPICNWKGQPHYKAIRQSLTISFFMHFLAANLCFKEISPYKYSFLKSMTM